MSNNTKRAEILRDITKAREIRDRRENVHNPLLRAWVQQAIESMYEELDDLARKDEER